MKHKLILYLVVGAVILVIGYFVVTSFNPTTNYSVGGNIYPSSPGQPPSSGGSSNVSDNVSNNSTVNPHVATSNANNWTPSGPTRKIGGQIVNPT